MQKKHANDDDDGGGGAGGSDDTNNCHPLLTTTYGAPITFVPEMICWCFELWCDSRSRTTNTTMAPGTKANATCVKKVIVKACALCTAERYAFVCGSGWFVTTIVEVEGFPRSVSTCLFSAPFATFA